MGQCSTCEENSSKDTLGTQNRAVELNSYSEMTTPLLKPPEGRQTSTEAKFNTEEKSNFVSGTFDQTTSTGEKMNKIDEYSGAICGVCNGGVRGWGIWCTVCGHGGHSEEILTWFDYRGANLRKLLQLERTVFACS